MSERRRGARAAGLAAVVVAAAVCGGAGAAQGTVGPHSSAGASCALSDLTLRMSAPQMYAADTTAGEDWQYVAWRPSVWSWNGSSWILAARGVWVWSWAYDKRAATYWYDYNGNYVGTTTAAQGAAVVQTLPRGVTNHYYYVSDEFYWYSSASAAAGYDHTWVTSYTGDTILLGIVLPLAMRRLAMLSGGTLLFAIGIASALGFSSAPTSAAQLAGFRVRCP